MSETVKGAGLQNGNMKLPRDLQRWGLLEMEAGGAEDLKTPMTNGLFYYTGLCSALGMCCQDLSGALSNCSGSAQGRLEGGGTLVGKASPSFPTQPLGPGLTMWGGPVAIADCPAGVCHSLAPSYLGTHLTSLQLPALTSQ